MQETTMRKTVLFGALVAAAFAIGTANAARMSSAQDYEGFWRNTRDDSGFIKFLEIDALDVGSLKIRAWLRCHPLTVRTGMLRDCRRWEADAVQADTLDRVLWVHPEAGVGRNVLTLTGDTLTVSTTDTGWRNEFKRVLGDAVTCLGMPRRSRDGSVICNAQGGRDLGKGGQTFKNGDPIFVMLRFDYLPVGEHRIQTWVSSRIGDRRTASMKWAYDTTFSNDEERWWLWFPANADRSGNWTIHLVLDDEVNLGSVDYCVDCVLE
jgi:hypothetical protein